MLAQHVGFIESLHRHLPDRPARCTVAEVDQTPRLQPAPPQQLAKPEVAQQSTAVPRLIRQQSVPARHVVVHHAFSVNVGQSARHVPCPPRSNASIELPSLHAAPPVSTAAATAAAAAPAISQRAPVVAQAQDVREASPLFPPSHHVDALVAVAIASAPTAEAVKVDDVGVVAQQREYGGLVLEAGGRGTRRRRSRRSRTLCETLDRNVLAPIAAVKGFPLLGWLEKKEGFTRDMYIRGGWGMGGGGR